MPAVRPPLLADGDGGRMSRENATGRISAIRGFWNWRVNQATARFACTSGCLRGFPANPDLGSGQNLVPTEGFRLVL